jgi:hypothetical protein
MLSNLTRKVNDRPSRNMINPETIAMPDNGEDAIGGRVAQSRSIRPLI